MQDGNYRHVQANRWSPPKRGQIPIKGSKFDPKGHCGQSKISSAYKRGPAHNRSQSMAMDERSEKAMDEASEGGSEANSMSNYIIPSKDNENLSDEHGHPNQHRNPVATGFPMQKEQYSNSHSHHQSDPSMANLEHLNPTSSSNNFQTRNFES